MAQPLQNLTISAPAFKGLNTQDSPLNADPTFAATADNCIIDRYGRIGARKGYTVLTTDKTELGSSSIETIGYFEDDEGNTKVFSSGNNKIMSGLVTLVDETPSGYTITSDRWRMANFNDKMYFFQRGHEPLVYDNANGLLAMSDHPNVVGTPPEANECIAAYGRLWCCDFTTEKQTVYWSDLLNGVAWSGGTSGSLNISKVWPDGHDEVVALAAHNGYLIIFGRNSIVVYQDADQPSIMSLVDTVGGLGCIDRNSIQHTGDDILFLSHVGLRSFGRTIQEKSMPSRDLTKNIRNDFNLLITGTNAGVKAIYSPENAFYLLTLTSNNITYCFDMRGALEDGSQRVTRWPSTPFNSFARNEDGTLYIGNENGISIYTGYTDNGASYPFRYYSNPLTFGDSSRVKVLKKIIPTIIAGGSSRAVIKWGYDFSQSFSSAYVDLPSLSAAEYNVAEYGIAEFSPTSSEILKKPINATGSGSVVTVGVEIDIDGQPFSLQEFNVQVLLGRMI